MNLLSILSFLVGLFSTFQAFKYSIGGVYVYPFTFVFGLFIFALLCTAFLSNVRIKILNFKKLSHLFIAIISLYFIEIIFSVTIPILDGADNPWIFASLKASIKFSIFLLFVWLAFNMPNKRVFEALLKGFILSIVIQVLWGLNQIICWYVFNIDINTIIFKQALGIDPGHRWSNYVIYPILRVTGLQWDPAYLGVWSLICAFWALILCKHKFLKYLLGGISLFVFINTFSRATFFGLLATLFFAFLYKVTKFIQRWKVALRSVTISIMSITIIALCIPIFIETVNLLGKSLNEVVKERTDTNNESFIRHMGYFKAGVYAISNNIPKMFFGYGYRNGVRGLWQVSGVQFLLPGILSFKAPSSPESDFVNAYLELGAIGFISFISIFIVGFLFLHNKKSQFFNLRKLDLISEESYLEGIRYINFFSLCYGLLFFSGWFYSYKDSLWYWLIIIMPLLVLKREIKNAK